MVVVNPVIGLMNETTLALSPVERWAAARQGDTNFISEHWIVIFAGVVLVVLTVLLIWISYGKVVQRRRSSSGKTFSDAAGQRGLSLREQKILMAISTRSGLARSGDIFTTEEAFARGVAKLVEQSRLQRGPEATQRLMGEMSCLREKLGFEPAPQVKVTSKHGVSSRQIPKGKKLHLTRRTSHTGDTIGGMVIENNAVELTVRLATSVRVTFGEVWRVRYYFGASIWEFDTSVMSCDRDVLVFRHSDSVRFVNRRRFVRVPVRNLAYISPFPFSRTLAGDEDVRADVEQGVAQASGQNWKPLEFVPAVVTELAGPGLRLEAPLEVKVGERVLVVFKLDEHQDQDARGADGVAVRIIEDIGQVRRAQPVKDGFSIAVELVGLDDSDISELIRAANVASSKARPADEQAETSAPTEEQAAESEAEPVTTQGV